MADFVEFLRTKKREDRFHTDPCVGLDAEELDTNQRHTPRKSQDNRASDHVMPSLFLFVPCNPKETEEKHKGGERGS